MPDLPSFFNRADFIGKYLSGYVFVVSYIVLFQSGLIFGQNLKLDVDLFTALIFIVAGPALGYTITHFHRSLPYIGNRIFGASNQAKQNSFDRSFWRYAKLRVLMEEGDKTELDHSEAEYDFDVSSGLVFLLLEILVIYNYVVFDLKINILFQIGFLIMASCLFVNAHYQMTRSVKPLISMLFRKYNVE